MPSHDMSPRRLMTVVAVLGAGILGLPTLAAAEQYRFEPTTLRDCDAGTRTGEPSDPINVAFVGAAATAQNSHNLIANEGLRWQTGGLLAGSTQYITDTSTPEPDGSPSQGRCHKQDDQNSRGILHKHHTRQFQLEAKQNDNFVTVQDAHRDVKTGGTKHCYKTKLGVRYPNDTVPRKVGYKGRTLSGFDHAQREFLDAYPNAHRGMQREPAKLAFMQCDPATGKQIQIPWNGIIQFFTVNQTH